MQLLRDDHHMGSWHLSHAIAYIATCFIFSPKICSCQAGLGSNPAPTDPSWWSSIAWGTWLLDTGHSKPYAPLNDTPPAGIGTVGYIVLTTENLTNGSKVQSNSDADSTIQFGRLANWLSASNLDVTVALLNSPFPPPCPGGSCSTTLECEPIFDCLFYWDTYTSVANDAAAKKSAFNSGFYICLTKQAALPSLRCVLQIEPLSQDITDQNPVDCSTATWDLSTTNWGDQTTNAQFEIFVNGGVDRNGNWWRGADPTLSLSEQMGIQLLNYRSFLCSLETPCTLPLDCATVGYTKTFGKPLRRTPWAFFVLNSLEHLNYQLSNQYQALQGAAIGATLATFNIDQFYPKQNQQFNLRDALTGLGTIFGAASGFVPIIGTGLGLAGQILPAIGNYISPPVATDPLVAQKTFAPKVQEIYSTYVRRIDELGRALFNGTRIKGAEGFNLGAVLHDGAWVNPSVLSQIPDVEGQLKVEILSRSINALWSTPTSNKRWVLFVDLQDDTTKTKCLNDTSGPQDSKYCDDGGVYYTYNFIETGDEEGHVGYPWGGEKLTANGIDISVCNLSRQMIHHDMLKSQ